MIKLFLRGKPYFLMTSDLKKLQLLTKAFNIARVGLAL